MSLTVHSANTGNNSESSLDSTSNVHDERYLKGKHEVAKGKLSIGRINNQGGGGIAEKICNQLFQNCDDTCLPGFKGCEVCVGGFENVDGECLLSLQFDELECDPMPRDGFPLPPNYMDFSFEKDVLMINKWVEQDEDYYGQTGFSQLFQDENIFCR